MSLADHELPANRRLTQARFLPRVRCALSKPLPGGCCRTPETRFVRNRRRPVRRLPSPAAPRAPLAADLSQPLRRPRRQGVPVVAPARRRRPHVIGDASAAVWPSWRSSRCFSASASPAGAIVYVLAEAYRPRWPGRVRVFQRRKQGVSQGWNTRKVEPVKHARRRASAPIRQSQGQLRRDTRRARQMGGAAAVVAAIALLAAALGPEAD